MNVGDKTCFWFGILVVVAGIGDDVLALGVGNQLKQNK
jgi:hypothetical protein